MQIVDVVHNLEQVRRRIAAAARRAGRDPETVGLVAVSKSIGPEQIRKAMEAGVQIFGESRVQELVRKHPDVPGPRWHFIGHLQRNKVKYLVGRVELIHSLDRWSLAEELDRRAREQGQPFRVLVQVKVGAEEGKFGVEAVKVGDFVNRVAGLRGLRVEGLMAMAPFCDDPEQARPYFREVKRLFDGLAGVPGFERRYLSMGMSSDYEVAVEEGANLVRVGTAIFGPRKCTLREG
ncbi:YggS family pyridoxal phosphate-dependent enzyme [Candidatus Desulforudis audaxviator]|uniref:Pyridoxal phosphate homeostasis protein n=1 Tax=Desulforudis audaxviator (strain MP104C) TaxID=477974 RepID=B1I4B2_DESAP|nr:YggS family pyridoxal phosphate-dependent enzyme [Candidatus Desulforudis audaxviator]ACA59922.1 alanine racemase domain protein [Candidatus Desulforudis audaxviator MP104C]AZK59935.1 alanine racemase domain protein [Candidatus Desulforudis audaxviator]